MRVIWTRTALRRLEAIERYIAKDRPVRAVTFVEELLDRGDQIGDNPYEGGTPRERPNGPCRQVLHGRYRIIYRILEEHAEVIILTVFEGHRPLRDSELEE